MSDTPQPNVPSTPDFAAPVIPPTPVAGTPAPQFGEFAPVEQAPAAPAAPAQPAASAYTPPAFPQPTQAPAPQQQLAAQQQLYPQAAYPQQTAYPQASVEAGPVYGQPGFGQTPVKRRAWDVVLTIVLLVLGLGGMLLGVFYGFAFSSPALLDDVFRQQGLNGFSGDVGATPLVLIVSHVLLYVIAAGVSILLIVKKKIAFYVPLIAGVIAAVVFWGALVALMLSDPGFSQMSGL